jgi:diguanylate cyclase (GGDEF)-like protein/PAS domain S-box-containing protein
MNVEGLSMRGIFENVEDCIFITDNSGRIVDLNESMYHKLFGETAQLSMKKVMDGDVKLVLSERIKDKDSYQNLFKNIEEDSSEKFNANIDCSFSKEDRTYSVHVSPLTVGGKERIGKLAIFRDITEIQELQNKLREQSIKDFITDIYNIRYFYDALGKNIHMFNRYNNPFCLLIVDVDNFKKFNDSKGHLKGDELLKATADVLKSNIRDDIDVASRYGGDEFAVILVNTSLQDAEEIARRIIEQYNKMSFDDISLSIGVSQYKEGMSREDIIKSADEAMYRAKAAGGNNVISK